MRKRIFDVAVSSIFLCILFLPLLILAVVVRARIGAPVLFRQVRPGLNEVPFEMLKFRTMTNATDERGCLLPDAERLTPFGRWLRSTSLDELPELWNVFKGDMSFVGPRPLLMEYLPLYSTRQKRRHEIKPGITGWAQVKGRNSISWEEKFELDVWYVENQSLLLDLKIIALTVQRVLNRDGINAEGEATMGSFKGSNTSH